MVRVKTFSATTIDIAKHIYIKRRAWGICCNPILDTKDRINKTVEKITKIKTYMDVEKILNLLIVKNLTITAKNSKRITSG